MSLKTLYYGFKFRSSDFADIHRWIMDWRAELSVLHNAALTDLFASLSVAMIDRAALNPGRDAGKSPLLEAWSTVWDKQREVRRTQLRNPVVDFDFSISILPHESGVYGIVFTERHDWRDMWLSKQFVEDFSYWSNSDKPDELTAEEWENRCATWSALLGQGKHRTPSMCGFHADCTLEIEHPSVKQVIAAIPSFDERVRNQARMRVLGAELERRRHEMAQTMAEEGDTPSRMFEMVAQAEKWLKTPDGKAKVDEAVAEISTVLKHEITAADLGEPLPEAPDGGAAPPSSVLQL